MSDTTLAQRPLTPYDRLKNMVRSDDVKQRFQDILGERAPAFLTSVISAVATNENLKDCDPSSILTAALKAAVLDLPIDQNIGFAWIIPYKSKDGKKAQFQVGYKGFIQLAVRTNQYEAINVVEIYEGEQVKVDRLSGRVVLMDGQRTSDQVSGYVAYFKLLGGLEKFLYMTIDEVKEHAKKFSKSYGDPKSPWATSFDSMAKKTVLKNLLTHYGIMSVQMQKAFREDTQNGDQEPPRTIGDVIEGELIEMVEEPEAPAEPEKEPAPDPDINAQIIQAAIAKNLTENEHSGRNSLKLSKKKFETVEDGLAWLQRYRAWRDQMDAKPQTAAKYADEGEMPK